MHALDHDMIMDFFGVVASVPQEPERTCHLFAIKKEEHVLVVNESVLVEWPLELVDTTIPAYSKLLRASRLSPELAKKLTTDPWGKVFIAKKADIYDCQEVEPADEDVFSYRAATGQVFHFNRHYKGLIDKIWPPYIINEVPMPSMDLKIHIRFGPLGPNTAPALLVVTENGRRRGVLASSRVG